MCPWEELTVSCVVSEFVSAEEVWTESDSVARLQGAVQH